MVTKRKVVKKDIKKDPLVTYALEVSRWVQEHFNMVIIGVVVLIAAISIVVFTTNSRRSSSLQSERQLAQAMALFQQRDYEAAKVTFGQVESRFGGRNKTIAIYYKALCNFEQRNYSQALLDFERYLGESSNFPEFKSAALYASALCQAGLGNDSEAAVAMEEAHYSFDKKDPRYLDSAYQAGELFAKAGNKERAATLFQTVVDEGSGSLKEKASVAVALLDQR
jgi:tetratricopeptide (TPR) repeat protein